MIKFKEKFGSLNLTEADGDTPPWSFQNLRKMGKVALALTREEIQNFPELGIEDAVEALGNKT